MIYENDIPPKRTEGYWNRRLNRCKVYNKANAYRFKPNGITDNRREWAEKESKRITNGNYGEYQIDHLLNHLIFPE